MDTVAAEAKRYLHHLYQMTEGDTRAQVSMYDVGEAMGLQREVAGKVAEDLIGDGLAEVKTLSGGIGISTRGIEAAQAGDSPAVSAVDDPALPQDPVLDSRSRQAVETILTELRRCIAPAPPQFDRLEEIIIDIKTIEVQLLSPAPKTAICREALWSLQSALDQAQVKDMADRLRRMTGR